MLYQYLWKDDKSKTHKHVHNGNCCHNKDKNENLNSPGMQFIPTPFEQSCLMPDQGRDCNDPPNRFYVYGVIARLALLAAAGELNG